MKLLLYAWVVIYIQGVSSCPIKSGYTNSTVAILDDPPVPPFKEGFLPIVLINSGGIPDEEIFVVVDAMDPSQGNQRGMLEVDGSDVGRINLGPGNAKDFSYALSDLPQVPGTNARLIYSPKAVSALVFVSLKNKLDMPFHDGAVIQPNPTNPGDSNYKTVWDIMEYNFETRVDVDATAVTQFSIPLFMTLSTAPPGADYSGLYVSRKEVMDHVVNSFSEVHAKEVWSKLILRDGDKVIRIVSPDKAITETASGADNLFDKDYLDNPSSGYSYIEDVWNFYKTHPLKLKIPPEDKGFTGTINADSTITFKADDGASPDITFASPTSSDAAKHETTTRLIFGALPLWTGPPTSDAIQLSKLFQEAIIAGLIPTSDVVSEMYLRENQVNFYKVNPNLNEKGQQTGPWYNLYSKALHDKGLIYTYGYDEPLWPEVEINSPFEEGKTFMSIEIRDVTD